MNLDIREQEYTDEGELQQYVKDGKSKEIGETFHTGLLEQIKDNEIPPQTLYALGEETVMCGTASFNTHQERCDACRDIGREFLHSFGDEEIQYLVWTSPCVATTPDSGYLPNDDPARETMGITFVLGLKGMHQAKDMDEYLDAISNWDYLFWSTKHHEGLPIENDYEGMPVVSSENYEKLSPEEQEEVIPIDNHNMMSCFVGICGNFKLIREMSKDKTAEDINYEMAPYFEERGMPQDLPILDRLKLAKRRCDEASKPTKLPKQLTTSKLTPLSRDVMESFGIDAAAILNQYSIELEDVVLEQAKHYVKLEAAYKDAVSIIQELSEFKQRVSQYLSSSTAQ